MSVNMVSRYFHFANKTASARAQSLFAVNEDGRI